MSEHYLKAELYELLRTDPRVFDWIEGGSLDGIWYWDLTDPGQEWMSPRFKAVFGYEPHEIPDTPDWWKANIHPEDLQTALDNATAHLANAHMPYDQTVRYRHRDGSTVWIRCRGLAIRDESGKPMRFLGAHTNVTNIKRAESDAVDRARELAQQNKRLAEFAHVAAHDLKEPLRNIEGLAEVLWDDHTEALAADGRKLLDMIRKSARRLALMVDDVHHLASLNGPAPRGRVPLGRFVSDVVTENAALGVDIKGHDDLPQVWGNHAQLRQLWTNLLANAIKFSPGIPFIRITHTETGTHHEFKIRDRGVGFRGDGDRLFRLFSRGHSQGEFPGTGLGLALCRRIVEEHGGAISIRSNDQAGTTVKFTLAKAP